MKTTFLLSQRIPREAQSVNCTLFLDRGLWYNKGIMEEQKKTEEKRTFLRVLKHQLKGPLTITKGYLSFWETETYKKFSDEKQRDFVVKSLDAAKRLDVMLNDAFTLLRLDAKEIESIVEEFDVKTSIEAGHEAALKAYPTKDITFTMNAPENLVPITTTKANLDVVVEKLITNAYKFTDKGAVTVTADQTGETTTIVVSDTGKGFTAEEIPQAFTRLFHGTLSMSIIKELTENVLQGTVGLVSEGAGKGSTFTVTIPNKLNEN